MESLPPEERQQYSLDRATANETPWFELLAGGQVEISKGNTVVVRSTTKVHLTPNKGKHHLWYDMLLVLDYPAVRRTSGASYLFVKSMLF